MATQRTSRDDVPSDTAAQRDAVERVAVQHDVAVPREAGVPHEVRGEAGSAVEGARSATSSPAPALSFTPAPPSQRPSEARQPPPAYWDKSYTQRAVPSSGSPAKPVLRRAWDERYLRELGGPAAASPRAPVQSSRRRPGWVLPVVLLVGAAMIVGLSTVLTSFLLGDDTDPAPVAGGQTSAATPAPPVEAPPAPGAAAPPVAAPASGVVLTATVLAGDALDVFESFTWPDGGPLEFTLELSDLSAVSGVTGEFDPSVTDLQVTLDGNPVPAAPIGESGVEWLIESPSGTPPTTMQIRYLLDGALIRSTPSQAGRGLAVLAPLSQNVIGSLPVRVETPGDAVLTISCPKAPDVAGQMCGRLGADRWTAEPPPGDPPVVLLQVDLAPFA